LVDLSQNRLVSLPGTVFQGLRLDTLQLNNNKLNDINIHELEKIVSDRRKRVPSTICQFPMPGQEESFSESY
jgi:hypothetical protein